ncbi:MAG: beta-ketoacyl-[acyl-carrier-protein] synthase family protein [Labilithrix sp.]
MTIVVTGVGAVTALGASARATWERVLRGDRALAPISLFDPGDVRSRVVAEVTGLAVPESASRTSELALRAAREAISGARLDVRAKRTGLIVGGTTAGMLETEGLLATLLSTRVGSAEREGALAKMLAHPLSAPTDRLVEELGPFARARSISSACSSGANALVIGALWLELGLVEAVVCGAADALCRVIVAGFNALGALDPEGARPFDASRKGLTLGEGAGFVVLERDAPEKRAKCTLLGWATRSEAHHITNPEASGAIPAAAMRAALARAGIGADDVDFVDAHGTGTPLNDPMETKALGSVFGARLRELPVSSQKGQIGHTLAAAGAVEAVITALAIEDGRLPPTGGLREPDATCALRHVRVEEKQVVRVAASSSFGFGGMDTVLVLGARGTAAPACAPRRSVVITGVAALTPAGLFCGPDAVDAAARRGGTSVTIADDALDAERARRLDRASRIATVVVRGALPVPADDAALVLGIAFGAVDATAEFMRRLRDKGPRLVRPADFPSLVPSSPAGHVSIYLGLRGPAFVVADLAASGECAVAQAWELVASGEVARACAAAVEEKSAIVEGALSAVFGGAGGETRAEGGASLTLEVDAGQPRMARLEGVWTWREEGPDLPAPPPGAIVVGTAPAPDAWRDCPRMTCEAAGTHEAVGAIGAAVAVARVARGEVPAALFVGSARGWCYAGLVTP